VDIEKTLRVAARPEQVWALLLDPQVMGACVPGMQSIEVISDVEYVSHIHVKISFISAKFKIKTTIVEQRAPHYLKSEGTGEDASVASSLKQSSEVFLTELDGGQTELRMKIKVDVLGRLGSFGLNVMKTKADRMWEEFAQNLAARLAPAAPADAGEPGSAAVPVGTATATCAPATGAVAVPPKAGSAQATAGRSSAAPARPGFWARLGWALFPGAASAPASDAASIRVEIRQGDSQITVHWPLQASAECAAWLQACVRQEATKANQPPMA
jgi:carbon monoxide dehydrogenase subunit G